MRRAWPSTSTLRGAPARGGTGGSRTGGRAARALSAGKLASSDLGKAGTQPVAVQATSGISGNRKRRFPPSFAYLVRREPPDRWTLGGSRRASWPAGAAEGTRARGDLVVDHRHRGRVDCRKDERSTVGAVRQGPAGRTTCPFEREAPRRLRRKRRRWWLRRRRRRRVTPRRPTFRFTGPWFGLVPAGR